MKVHRIGKKKGENSERQFRATWKKIYILLYNSGKVPLDGSVACGEGWLGGNLSFYVLKCKSKIT